MKRICVFDEESILTSELSEMFKKDRDTKINRFSEDQFEKMLKTIPDILIINEDSISINIVEYCKKIRENEDNSITPIVVISSNKEKEHIIEIMKNEVEIYITKPVDNEIIYYNIKNIMRLLNCNRMISPLTGLPGNVQIQAEMKKRLTNGSTFAMLYIDLDNFKAYNDKYGFSNGDEIIKLTARVVTNNVLKDDNDQNFVGHIGGDDFVAITEDTDYETVCQNIIAEFDNQISKYFTEEDFERGYLEVENRKGIMEEFPITSISIGVVEANKTRFKNTLEIGEAGAVVKHLAKTIFGSTYVIDRRKNRE